MEDLNVQLANATTSASEIGGAGGTVADSASPVVVTLGDVGTTVPVVETPDVSGSEEASIPLDVLIGARGQSAYEVAVDNGFVGTVDQWLASLKGVSVVSVEQEVTSQENGGVNVVKVTLSDGTVSRLEIRNGYGGSGGVQIVQETGNSMTNVMSQKAVTDTIDTTIGNINSLLATI